MVGPRLAQLLEARLWRSVSLILGVAEGDLLRRHLKEGLNVLSPRVKLGVLNPLTNVLIQVAPSTAATLGLPLVLLKVRRPTPKLVQ